MGLAGSHCNYSGWFGGANAPGVDDIHSGKMYVVSVSYKAILRANKHSFYPYMCSIDTYFLYLQYY